VSSAEASPSVPRDLDAADLNMADPTSRVNADSDGGTAAAAPRTSPGRTIRSAMRSERAVEATKQITALSRTQRVTRVFRKIAVFSRSPPSSLRLTRTPTTARVWSRAVYRLRAGGVLVWFVAARAHVDATRALGSPCRVFFPTSSGGCRLPPPRVLLIEAPPLPR